MSDQSKEKEPFSPTQSVADLSAFLMSPGSEAPKEIEQPAPVQESPDIQMREAFEEGNLEQAIEAKSRGANPLERTRYGQPFIVQAAEKNCVDMIEFLLAHNETVDNRDNYGKTALIAAACNGSLNAVQFLLEKGADIHAQDDLGRDALANASTKGNNPDLVELLVITGAEVNKRDKHGLNPACMAAMKGNAEILARLITLGADPHFVVTEGHYKNKSPLFFAVSNGHQDIFDILCRDGANPLTWTDQGNTLLHVAAEKGQPSMVNLLIEFGIDLMAKNDKGHTAHDVTVNHERPNVNVNECKVLLEQAMR